MPDDDPIPISALQHYLYCPRQWALIHLEQIWSENAFTARGRLLHRKTDVPVAESRHGVHTVTAMPLAHEELGIAGVADVVEFHQAEHGVLRVVPVEYKRGRPKQHRADEVQLCAQALCLESMLATHIPEGFLFYGETRRRSVVPLDSELRDLTTGVIHAVREARRVGHTPAAEYEARRCDACSLIEDCQPRLGSKSETVQRWLARQLNEEIS